MKCSNCNYIYNGVDKIANCPKCGHNFGEIDEEGLSKKSKTAVAIGAAAGAVAGIASLAAKDGKIFASEKDNDIKNDSSNFVEENANLGNSSNDNVKNSDAEISSNAESEFVDLNENDSLLDVTTGFAGTSTDFSGNDSLNIGDDTSTENSENTFGDVSNVEKDDSIDATGTPIDSQKGKENSTDTSNNNDSNEKKEVDSSEGTSDYDGEESSGGTSDTVSEESAEGSANTEGEESAEESTDTEGEENAEESANTEVEESAEESANTEGEESAEESTDTEGEESAEESTDTEGEESAEESTDTEGEESAEESTDTEGEESAEESIDTEGEKSAEESANTGNGAAAEESYETSGSENSSGGSQSSSSGGYDIKADLSDVEAVLAMLGSSKSLMSSAPGKGYDSIFNSNVYSTPVVSGTDLLIGGPRLQDLNADIQMVALDDASYSDMNSLLTAIQSQTESLTDRGLSAFPTSSITNLNKVIGGGGYDGYIAELRAKVEELKEMLIKSDYGENYELAYNLEMQQKLYTADAEGNLIPTDELIKLQSLGIDYERLDEDVYSYITTYFDTERDELTEDSYTESFLYRCSDDATLSYAEVCEMYEQFNDQLALQVGSLNMSGVLDLATKYGENGTLSDYIFENAYDGHDDPNKTAEQRQLELISMNYATTMENPSAAASDFLENMFAYCEKINTSYNRQQIPAAAVNTDVHMAYFDSDGQVVLAPTKPTYRVSKAEMDHVMQLTGIAANNLNYTNIVFATNLSNEKVKDGSSYVTRTLDYPVFCGVEERYDAATDSIIPARSAIANDYCNLYIDMLGDSQTEIYANGGINGLSFWYNVQNYDVINPQWNASQSEYTSGMSDLEAFCAENNITDLNSIKSFDYNAYTALLSDSKLCDSDGNLLSGVEATDIAAAYLTYASECDLDAYSAFNEEMIIFNSFALEMSKGNKEAEEYYFGYLGGDYNSADFLLTTNENIANVLTSDQLIALNDNLTNNSIYHTDLTLRYEQTYSDYLNTQISEAKEEEANNWGTYILSCFEMMALSQQGPGFTTASINAYNSQVNSIVDRQQEALDNIDYCQDRSSALNVALVDTSKKVDNLTLQLENIYPQFSFYTELSVQVFDTEALKYDDVESYVRENMEQGDMSDSEYEQKVQDSVTLTQTLNIAERMANGESVDMSQFSPEIQEYIEKNGDQLIAMALMEKKLAGQTVDISGFSDAVQYYYQNLEYYGNNNGDEALKTSLGNMYFTMNYAVKNGSFSDVGLSGFATKFDNVQSSGFNLEAQRLADEYLASKSDAYLEKCTQMFQNGELSINDMNDVYAKYAMYSVIEKVAETFVIPFANGLEGFGHGLENAVTNTIEYLAIDLGLKDFCESLNLPDAMLSNPYMAGGLLYAIANFDENKGHFTSVEDAMWSNIYAAAEDGKTSWGKADFYIMQATQSIGNMAVPMLVSMIPGCQAVGSALLFTSAYGNTFEACRVEGMNAHAALVYSLCSAGTELVMEKVLGGMPGLSEAASSIGLTGYAKSMLSEAREEMLQEFIDPFLKDLAFAISPQTDAEGNIVDSGFRQMFTDPAQYFGNYIVNDFDMEAIVTSGIVAMISAGITNSGKLTTAIKSKVEYGSWSLLEFEKTIRMQQLMQQGFTKTEASGFIGQELALLSGTDIDFNSLIKSQLDTPGIANEFAAWQESLSKNDPRSEFTIQDYVMEQVVTQYVTGNVTTLEATVAKIDAQITNLQTQLSESNIDGKLATDIRTQLETLNNSRSSLIEQITSLKIDLNGSIDQNIQSINELVDARNKIDQKLETETDQSVIDQLNNQKSEIDNKINDLIKDNRLLTYRLGETNIPDMENRIDFIKTNLENLEQESDSSITEMQRLELESQLNRTQHNLANGLLQTNNQIITELNNINSNITEPGTTRPRLTELQESAYRQIVENRRKLSDLAKLGIHPNGSEVELSYGTIDAVKDVGVMNDILEAGNDTLNGNAGKVIGTNSNIVSNNVETLNNIVGTGNAIVGMAAGGATVGSLVSGIQMGILDLENKIKNFDKNGNNLNTNEDGTRDTRSKKELRKELHQKRQMMNKLENSLHEYNMTENSPLKDFLDQMNNEIRDLELGKFDQEKVVQAYETYIATSIQDVTAAQLMAEIDTLLKGINTISFNSMTFGDKLNSTFERIEIAFDTLRGKLDFGKTFDSISNLTNKLKLTTEQRANIVAKFDSIKTTFDKLSSDIKTFKTNMDQAVLSTIKKTFNSLSVEMKNLKDSFSELINNYKENNAKAIEMMQESTVDAEFEVVETVSILGKLTSQINDYIENIHDTFATLNDLYLLDGVDTRFTQLMNLFRVNTSFSTVISDFQNGKFEFDVFKDKLNKFGNEFRNFIQTYYSKDAEIFDSIDLESSATNNDTSNVVQEYINMVVSGIETTFEGLSNQLEKLFVASDAKKFDFITRLNNMKTDFQNVIANLKININTDAMLNLKSTFESIVKNLVDHINTNNKGTLTVQAINSDIVIVDGSNIVEVSDVKTDINVKVETKQETNRDFSDAISDVKFDVVEDMKEFDRNSDDVVSDVKFDTDDVMKQLEVVDNISTDSKVEQMQDLNKNSEDVISDVDFDTIKEMEQLKTDSDGVVAENTDVIKSDNNINISETTDSNGIVGETNDVISVDTSIIEKALDALKIGNIAEVVALANQDFEVVKALLDAGNYSFLSDSSLSHDSLVEALNYLKNNNKLSELANMTFDVQNNVQMAYTIFDYGLNIKFSDDIKLDLFNEIVDRVLLSSDVTAEKLSYAKGFISAMGYANTTIKITSLQSVINAMNNGVYNFSLDQSIISETVTYFANQFTNDYSYAGQWVNVFARTNQWFLYYLFNSNVLSTSDIITIFSYSSYDATSIVASNCLENSLKIKIFKDITSQFYPLGSTLNYTAMGKAYNIADYRSAIELLYQCGNGLIYQLRNSNVYEVVNDFCMNNSMMANVTSVNQVLEYITSVTSSVKFDLLDFYKVSDVFTTTIGNATVRFIATDSSNISGLYQKYAEFQNYFAKMPPILRNVLKTANFYDIHNPADPYWAVHYNNDINYNFDSQATGGGGVFNLWGVRYFDEYTVAHELGHSFDTALHEMLTGESGGFFSMAENSAWQRAIQEDGKKVTDYGESSFAEDFAESMKYFVNNRAWFEENYEHRAAILKPMLKSLAAYQFGVESVTDMKTLTNIMVNNGISTDTIQDLTAKGYTFDQIKNAFIEHLAFGDDIVTSLSSQPVVSVAETMSNINIATNAINNGDIQTAVDLSNQDFSVVTSLIDAGNYDVVQHYSLNESIREKAFEYMRDNNKLPNIDTFDITSNTGLSFLYMAYEYALGDNLSEVLPKIVERVIGLLSDTNISTEIKSNLLNVVYNMEFENSLGNVVSNMDRTVASSIVSTILDLNLGVANAVLNANIDLFNDINLTTKILDAGLYSFLGNSDISSDVINTAVNYLSDNNKLIAIRGLQFNVGDNVDLAFNLVSKGLNVTYDSSIRYQVYDQMMNLITSTDTLSIDLKIGAIRTFVPVLNNPSSVMAIDTVQTLSKTHPELIAEMLGDEKYITFATSAELLSNCNVESVKSIVSCLSINSKLGLFKQTLSTQTTNNIGYYQLKSDTGFATIQEIIRVYDDVAVRDKIVSYITENFAKVNGKTELNDILKEVASTVGYSKRVLYRQGQDLLRNESLNGLPIDVYASDVSSENLSKLNSIVEAFKRNFENPAIPKVAKMCLEKASFYDVTNPEDYYWSIQYGVNGWKDIRSGFRSAATGGHGTYTSWAFSGSTVDTISHELGHSLDTTIYKIVYGNQVIDGAGGFFSKVPNSEWQQAIAADGNYVSTYGKNSPSEDLADSLKMFVTNRAKFERNHPNRATELKRLLRMATESKLNLANVTDMTSLRDLMIKNDISASNIDTWINNGFTETQIREAFISHIAYGDDMSKLLKVNKIDSAVKKVSSFFKRGGDIIEIADNFGVNPVVDQVNQMIATNGFASIDLTNAAQMSVADLRKISDLSKVEFYVSNYFSDMNGVTKTKYLQSKYRNRHTYTGYEMLSINAKLEQLQSKIDMSQPISIRARQIYELLVSEIPIMHDYRASATHLDISQSLRGLTANNAVGKPGLVCAGFASVYKELCDRCGVPCDYIRGKAVLDPLTGRGGGHAWNVVVAENGKIIPVDATWHDDTWFGGSQRFADSHIADADEVYNNYYGVEGESDEIINRIVQTMDAKNGYGNGILALRRYLETGDVTKITRTDGARSLLQQLTFDDINQYLKTHTAVDYSVYRNDLNTVFSNLVIRFNGTQNALVQLRTYVRTGDLKYITSQGGARDMISKIPMDAVKEYLNNYLSNPSTIVASSPAIEVDVSPQIVDEALRINEPPQLDSSSNQLTSSGNQSVNSINAQTFLHDIVKVFRNAFGKIDIAQAEESGAVFIERDPSKAKDGAREKNWVYGQNGSFLFKKTLDMNYEAFGEILGYEFANLIGLDCAKYDFATLDGQDGVISYNILAQNGEELISGKNILDTVDQFYITPMLDLISKYNSIISNYNSQATSLEAKRAVITELISLYNCTFARSEGFTKFVESINIKKITSRNFDKVFNKFKEYYDTISSTYEYSFKDWNKKKSVVKSNNLYDIWTLVDKYCDLHGYKLADGQNIMRDLVKMTVYDLILYQGDRHISNWSIILNNKTKTIRFAPIYDNSNICNLNEGKDRIASKVSSISAFEKNKNRLTGAKLERTVENVNRQVTGSDSKIMVDYSDNNVKGNNIDMLGKLIETSDQATVDMIREICNEFTPENINKVFEKIQTEYGTEVPNDVKVLVAKTIEVNMEKINKLFDDHGDSNNSSPSSSDMMMDAPSQMDTPSSIIEVSDISQHSLYDLFTNKEFRNAKFKLGDETLSLVEYAIRVAFSKGLFFDDVDAQGEFSKLDSVLRGKATELNKTLSSWAAPSDSSNPLVIALQSAADTISKLFYVEAQKLEIDITKDMRSLEVDGAYLTGIDYRLKSVDSLSRKIISKTTKKYSTVEDAKLHLEDSAKLIVDRIRYTLILNESNYTDGVKKSLENLVLMGYEILDMKNAWSRDTRTKYQGINVGLKAPNGAICELQFHTELSFITKETLTHEYYEVERSDEIQTEYRDLATEIQCLLQENVIVPADVETINFFTVSVVEDIDTFDIKILDGIVDPDTVKFKVGNELLSLKDFKVRLALREGSVFSKDTLIEDISNLDFNLEVEQLSSSDYIIKDKTTGKFVGFIAGDIRGTLHTVNINDAITRTIKEQIDLKKYFSEEDINEYYKTHKLILDDLIYDEINKVYIRFMKDRTPVKFNVENFDKLLNKYNLEDQNKILNSLTDSQRIEYLSHIKGVEIKNEILATLDSTYTDLEKARKLYIELAKRVTYDATYARGNFITQSIIYSRNVSFENLTDNNVICKGWAELYYELLLEAGFNPEDVKILSASDDVGSHRWVTLDLHNGKILIADAADAIAGGNDLSRAKFDGKLFGFVTVTSALANERLTDLFFEDVDYYKSLIASSISIDRSIGYLNGQNYVGEAVQKAKKLFNFSFKKKKIDLANVALKMFDLPITEGSSGLDVYVYYSRLISYNSFTYDSLTANYGFRELERGKYEYFLIVKSRDNNKYMVYTKSLGKVIFDDYNEFEKFIGEHDIIEEIY